MSYDIEWHYVGEPGEPVFKGNWCNYNTTEKLRFMKGADGIVKVEGIPKEDNSNNGTIFTLPEGYRPSTRMQRTVGDDDVYFEISGDVVCYVKSQIVQLNHMFSAGLSEVETLQGAPGAPPEHEWDGTRLRFKNPNGTWGEYVELKADKIIIYVTSNQAYGGDNYGQ